MNFEIYKDSAGKWRWRLKSSNYKIIGDSGEGYNNKTDCRAMVDYIKSNASTATVTEVREMAIFGEEERENIRGRELGRMFVHFFACPIYPPRCLAEEMDERKDAEIKRTR